MNIFVVLFKIADSGPCSYYELWTNTKCYWHTFTYNLRRIPHTFIQTNINSFTPQTLHISFRLKTLHMFHSDRGLCTCMFIQTVDFAQIHSDTDSVITYMYVSFRLRLCKCLILCNIYMQHLKVLNLNVLQWYAGPLPPSNYTFYVSVHNLIFVLEDVNQ